MLSVLSETIQEFNGTKFYLQRQSGYFRRWGARPCSLLHRSVWTDAHGPIPEGYVVHHIDGDKGNNELGNLELLPIAEHHSLHSSSEEHLAKFAPNRVLGTRAAWEKASEKQYVCEECGAVFNSHTSHQKYCSKRCRSKAYGRIYPRTRKKVA